MDVSELLAQAASMVPPAAANEAGLTVADAYEYLDHNEWEIALDILADLEGWPAPVQWWDLLVEAAELMCLTESAHWCRWARWESANGIIRAELRLLPAEEGGRRTAIPGKGVLRPLWDIGRRTAAGNPDLRVARIWVEYAAELAPGAIGTVRLAPLGPEAWCDLQPGQTITMHEGTPAVGTATIIETPATR
ncbi:hypothetical protein Rhe02_65340 [Rhizocola hellebori]|uniref:Uncharacterized protein n=1 Tax=Rhizocola hellebori TaxID=1392758 RepID=A0A8J3QF60_9ACTN|nr:hypothetical protein [Rhizocola hellebori]GIH08467.1 hypothetical protein Rhe02_65340 [Rhizocola hellebori]